MALLGHRECDELVRGWPLRAEGVASAQQVGLVGCYLKDLAQKNMSGLATIAASSSDPVNQISYIDLRYSAAARGGLATATFAPNPSDTTDA